VFLSDHSNVELADLIARGDLVAVQQALSDRREQTTDNSRWLELSADLVKVFVQQSRYAEAEEIVHEIETRLSHFSFRRRLVAYLSVLLCLTHVLLPDWASKRVTHFIARLSGFPPTTTYVLDSLLWGVFWQDLHRAQGYTILMCFASGTESERFRAYAMLSYCLLIRGWEFLGYRGLLKVLSQSKKVSSKQYLDTYFWMGISNRWRSRAPECLWYHASFEQLFPNADGFYRIISDSSRLQLAVAELGPTDVMSYYNKCHSETISMKHGRHQIHLRGARACLAGLTKEIQPLETDLIEAKNIVQRVANNLDALLLSWLSTIAYLNAGQRNKAEMAFAEFSRHVRRYGNPKLFLQEQMRLTVLLDHGEENTFSSYVSFFGYLAGSFALGSPHRFFRALKHVTAWMRDGRASYWSAGAQLRYFVEQPREQDKPEQFISLFSSISEEFSKLATRLDDQFIDLGEVIALIKRTFSTNEVFVEPTLDGLIDRIRTQNVLLNSLVRNEGSRTVRVPTTDGRIFIGVEESDRLSKESLAIGVLVQRSQFKEESSDLISFSLGTLIKYFFLMKDIRRSYRQEEEAQRNHAIAETARMLAHDIRKPFSMLRAMIHALSNVSSAEEMKTFSERNLPHLIRGIQSVESMVSDIIEFGRPASFSAAPVAVAELLDRSLSSVFELESTSNVQLQYSLQHSHKVHGDFSKCLRLVSNIVGNAANALHQTKSPRIWIRVEENADQRTEFVIGNNGPAIEGKDLKEIFAPFFTKNKKEGTGLGLAIAKKVVESHGGSIRCESKPNVTEFIFSLPTSIEREESEISLPTLARDFGQRMAAQKAYEAVPSNAANEKQLLGQLLANLDKHGKSLSLLIVDDEASYRSSLEKLVKSDAKLASVVQLFEAENFGDAIQIIEQRKLDVLVCDIDLRDPRGDGLDIVSKARSLFTAAEICIHSNRYLSGDSQRALAAGADSFFPKPMGKEHLIKLFNSWIEKQQRTPVEKVSRKPKIAIIDDDPLFGECWRMSLKDKFEIVSFDSPRTFLNQYTDISTLSCVITDFDFGKVKSDIGAIELARHLRGIDSTLPVILASGYDLDDTSAFSAVIPKGDIPDIDVILKVMRPTA